MMQRTSLAKLAKVAGLSFAAVAFASTAAAATCESLIGLKLQYPPIPPAESIAAGAFTQPDAGGKGKGKGGNAFADLQAFCRVAATIRPSTDSDIKIEVWMPASGWNNKFVA